PQQRFYKNNYPIYAIGSQIYPEGGLSMALVDGGDLVVRAIKQEGVDTIFTLCGGHVQAIYDSCLDEGVNVIDVRHEQVAGHAAEGWSRATRRCGVAV